MLSVTKVKCTCHWPEEEQDFIFKVKKGERKKDSSSIFRWSLCTPNHPRKMVLGQSRQGLPRFSAPHPTTSKDMKT